MFIEKITKHKKCLILQKKRWTLMLPLPMPLES